MAITSSGSVLMRLPTDASYGEVMSHFRERLDANKIEALLFKSGVLMGGSITCEIVFRIATDTVRFNKEFG